MLADHRQLDASNVVDGQLLEARGHGAGLFEPAHASLDDIATPVLLGIELGRAPAAMGNLVAPLRNHDRDVALAQPLADVAMAVTLVAGHALGPLTHRTVGATDTHGVQQRFGVWRFVGLAGADLDCQRQPSPIRHQVQLGAPAAAATPEDVIVGLVWQRFFFPAPAAAWCARTLEPSTHHSDQSMLPAASNCV